MTSIVFGLFFLSPFLIVACALYLIYDHFGGFAGLWALIELRIARWQIRAVRRRTIAQMRRINDEAERIVRQNPHLNATIAGFEENLAKMWRE